MSQILSQPSMVLILGGSMLRAGLVARAVQPARSMARCKMRRAQSSADADSARSINQDTGTVCPYDQDRR